MIGRGGRSVATGSGARPFRRLHLWPCRSIRLPLAVSGRNTRMSEAIDSAADGVNGLFARAPPGIKAAWRGAVRRLLSQGPAGHPPQAELAGHAVALRLDRFRRRRLEEPGREAREVRLPDARGPDRVPLHGRRAEGHRRAPPAPRPEERRRPRPPPDGRLARAGEGRRRCRRPTRPPASSPRRARPGALLLRPQPARSARSSSCRARATPTRRSPSGPAGTSARSSGSSRT